MNDKEFREELDKYGTKDESDFIKVKRMLDKIQYDYEVLLPNMVKQNYKDIRDYAKNSSI